MSVILGIDPGPEKSAFAVWHTDIPCVATKGYWDNNALLQLLIEAKYPYSEAAIEMVACYGLPVGKEVLDTALWVGRFKEAILENQSINAELFSRREIVIHLCGSTKAKKAHVNQALIDRFGGKGTVKNQGPFYGVKDHIWDACAVAITYGDLYVNSSKVTQTA